jgi:2,3-bisphosphoglycerate-dependent phosphoglycerate mutase
MAKIYIFRHGQTTDNKNHIFSGFRDVGLTLEGEEEAKKIGEKLKDVPVNKAYTSDQIRSKRTLELVLGDYHKNVEIIEDERIKERDYGILTGLSKDEIAKADPKNYALWHRSYNIAPPNGESIQDVEKRVMNFLRENIPTWKKNDVIFISAHGNSLRPMRKFFEHLTNEEMCSFEHTPAKIYYYEI